MLPHVLLAGFGITFIPDRKVAVVAASWTAVLWALTVGITDRSFGTFVGGLGVAVANLAVGVACAALFRWMWSRFDPTRSALDQRRPSN